MSMLTEFSGDGTRWKQENIYIVNSFTINHFLYHQTKKCKRIFTFNSIEKIANYVSTSDLLAD